MEGALPFLAAFGLVALLELGDKTQLATIALAARHPWRPVLAGAALGLIAATAVGVAVGATVAAGAAGQLVWVKVAGGAAFIALGAWGLARREEAEEEERPTDGRGAFAAALSVNFLAEMGDKTQVAVIVLVAAEAAPASVFAGASTALAAVAALSVWVGTAMAERLKPSTVRAVASALFVVAGLLLVGEALMAG